MKIPAPGETDMSASQPLEERLIALEQLVTHYERDMGALNAVVIEQQQQIDALQRLIGRLDDRVARLADDDGDRDARFDRPPHY